MAPQDRPRFCKPAWMADLQWDLRKKASGRWYNLATRDKLRLDLKACMRLNIPFKTKSVEYKPSDQWIYVQGRRTMKYDLRTGYIVEFTFSGVYNKVTSLFLRLMDINVKLKGRKLIWIHSDPAAIRPDGLRLGARPRSPTVETEVDLNSVYVNTNVDGFCLISHDLSRENNRIRRSLDLMRNV
jgi:hypothetical protein